MEPRTTSISVYSTELSISSDGIASISGFVRGKLGITSTYVEVTLQKSVSGTWVDVESWENSSDTRSTSVAETYLVSRGTYRVTMTCSADRETKTATSAVKKCPQESQIKYIIEYGGIYENFRRLSR